MIQNNLIKGTLNPIILKLLSENKRMYGYEITQKVKELTNGKIELTFGALYPILHKLEQEGVVRTESEVINNRNRIYYSLTETGKNTAKERIEELEDFVNTIKALLQPNMGLQYVHVK
ncbi:MAG TPA: PadR family transcriptional regulator [Tenuifilaceae bacterium]|nr:PadR family transcriptional regulator [Tenuifilaceae bacterium]HPI46150.1 PadR family transcriptional regulator [Tenuifilaceae bacterium]HPN22455.1 PadR family transcriptional regulator [Tenuifilaceae bacterium]